MVINNKTPYAIFVETKMVEPMQTVIVNEHVFDTVNIHANAGSIMIVTEYCTRSITNFGNIEAVELKQLDEFGMKIINVVEADNDVQRD